MLTDIFATRYEERVIWTGFSEKERRFNVQMAKLITEQLFPYWVGGNENSDAKASLTAVHDRVAMELGLDALSPRSAVYNRTVNGAQIPTTYTWKMDRIIKNFLTYDYNENLDADVFMKRRLSLVELAFRTKGYQVERDNQTLDARMVEADKPRPYSSGIRLPGKASDAVKARNWQLNQAFNRDMDELSARLQQAKFGMNYHNGFLQFSEDALVAQQVEKPFWALVGDPVWSNVDTDMKEAVDRRDTQGRDPAFYAVRALESTIKIISDTKKWTTGNERGAANYIDNLGKKANAFLETWEGDALKALFSKVRNPLGHGPGAAPMPTFTPSQTDWIIETSMSWIKSLISRR